MNVPAVLESIARNGNLSDDDRRLLMQAASVVRIQLVRPWDADVRDFQIRFGHFVAKFPTIPDRDVLVLRQRLIKEEFQELYQAIDMRDLPEIARECVDLVYVVLGTMNSVGLDFTPFWNQIHAANMLKVPNPERNGKTLKPEGWVKPCTSDLIHGDVLDLDPAETLRLRKRS